MKQPEPSPNNFNWPILALVIAMIVYSMTLVQRCSSWHPPLEYPTFCENVK